MTELEQRANDEARHAHRELIETLTERAETAEARLAEAVEGLREIAGMGVVCASDHAVRTLAKIKGENQ